MGFGSLDEWLSDIRPPDASSGLSPTKALPLTFVRICVSVAPCRAIEDLVLLRSAAVRAATTPRWRCLRRKGRTTVLGRRCCCDAHMAPHANPSIHKILRILLVVRRARQSSLSWRVRHLWSNRFECRISHLSRGSILGILPFKQRGQFAHDRKHLRLHHCRMVNSYWFDFTAWPEISSMV